MLLSVKFKEARCLELAGTNFATATDLADIMVREKQIPFRTAHKIVGRIVNEATASGLKEADITSEYIDDIASELGFEKLGLEDDLVQKALNPLENVKMRTVPGGPSPAMVEIARDNIKEFLNEEFEKKGSYSFCNSSASSVFSCGWFCDSRYASRISSDNSSLPSIIGPV